MHFHCENNESSSAITFGWEEKNFLLILRCCRKRLGLASSQSLLLYMLPRLLLPLPRTLLLLLMLLLLLLFARQGLRLQFYSQPLASFMLQYKSVCACVVCASVFVLRAPLIERTKCKRKEKELKTIINTHNKIKFLLCFENTWMSLICPRTHKCIQKETESTWSHPQHRCGLLLHKGQGAGKAMQIGN